MRNAITFILLLLSLCPLSAQNATGDVEQLFQRFKSAATFDYRYPREKVYMHFDNTAYLEGDTLWYKAYVVRASSHTPTDLSGVLYVELLDADGQQIEQQILQIDSLGQADGCFKLGLPVRAGYYEVRAFTREMVNWGLHACFSRVFAVFAPKETAKAQVAAGNYDPSLLELPMPEEHKGISLGSPRPYTMTTNKDVRLVFFPEGGWRGKGVAQRIAFELTDGCGHALEDEVKFFSDGGQLLATARPEHEGRGTALIPATAGRGYATVGTATKRYLLPIPVSGFALRADRADDGLLLQLEANDSARAATGLLGIAVFNRERVTYFDTLSLSPGTIERFVPQKALRGGVSRIEVYGTDGASRASRLVWNALKPAEERRVNISLRQNRADYSSFEPAVLTMELTDTAGAPVQTTFSIAVRDDAGNIVADGDAGMAADLLLGSEVRGYIANPAAYFAKDDAAHRRMLDLLLLVQGWRATPFDVMCDATPFDLKQPIEERLILRGSLYTDNKRRKPQAGYNLSMKMYSLTGGSYEGTTKTDADGKFAFETKAYYEGDYHALFTSKSDDGKRHWGRLMLDRWFSPQPRAFNGRELDFTLFSPDDPATPKRKPETFEWTDTLPTIKATTLGEATVVHKNKYRGFTGNRYTYNGGERTGQKRASKFYNIQREAEHYKDMGYEPGTIWDFLSVLDASSSHIVGNMSAVDNGVVGIDNSGNATASTSSDEAVYETLAAEAAGEQSANARIFQQGLGNSDQSGTNDVTGTYTLNGRQMKVYINNMPYDELVKNYPEMYLYLAADEIKSASVVQSNLRDDAMTGSDVNRSKNRYAIYLYEIPDLYRYKARKEKKGLERRVIHGYTPGMTFYNRNYRGFDTPSSRDVRRTLYWNPSVSTDKAGKASVIFFTNARVEQRLDISLRGVTKTGQIVER